MQCARLSHGRLLKLMAELVRMQGISRGASLRIFQIFKFHYSWGKKATLLQQHAVNTRVVQGRR